MVIGGGTVYTPDGPRELDVDVREGRVAALEPWSAHRHGADYVDARGLSVLPGAIDLHVHGRDPGWPEKETFATLTDAAALGGVTTVVDMPNTLPGVFNAGVFERKLSRVQPQARVDFGLWGLVRSTTMPEDLVGLARAGAAGFKAYLGYAFRTQVGQVTYEADGSDVEPPPEYGTLASLASTFAELGLPVAVHAEDPSTLRAFSRPARSYDDLLGARPAVAEAIAVASTGAIAREGGFRLHIAHLSSVAGLAALEAARRSGAEVTAETTPHHLFLTAADAARLGALLKAYPLVRGGDDRDALRSALVSGAIDAVATDHAPHTDAEKLGADFETAAAGTAGVQYLLLACLELARQRRDLGLAALWAARRPAEILGLYPRKGAVQEGSDADLVLVDLDASTEAGPGIAGSRQRHSALDGLRLSAGIREVYLRGTPLVRAGQLLAGARVGAFVSPCAGKGSSTAR
jgi:dihydroorotase